VRDYLEEVGWDKNSPPRRCLKRLIEKTRDKYMEAYTQLTGKKEL
jgi:phosphoribosylaminoimidazole-succinocarboxamide synthase